MPNNKPYAATTLRPGILVSLKTSITGNVTYKKRDLSQRVDEDGASIKEWETIRTVFDPDEYKRATKVRQDARNMIARACIGSAFGMLCPTADKERLEAAIKEARAMTRNFNAEATLSNVRVYVVLGTIADSDEEAAKAISSEVADLVKLMQDGIANVDVKKIRDAAKRALDVGRMTNPDPQSKIAELVKIARASANKYAKAGEAAAVEVDLAAIEELKGRRLAFIDMEEEKEVVHIKRRGGRAVELPKDVAAPKAATPRKGRKVVEEKPDGLEEILPPVAMTRSRPSTARRIQLD